MAGDLLGGLTVEQRRLVESRMTRRTFAKGQTLFLEGDAGDSVYLLQRGRVAVQTSTPQGDVVTLTVLGAGESFGEQALIGSDARRTATVVALEACEARVLYRSDFDELRTQYPAVDRFLVELLAAHVRRLSGQVVEALYVPVEQRVIRRTLDLAELYAPSRSAAASGVVEIALRQEDLATMAGTTRQTANKVLKQLEAAGIVSLERGRLVVHDRARLRAAVR